MPTPVQPASVLGPLNETERKNAPRELYLVGDPELLRQHLRVSIIGSRKASVEHLKYAHDLAFELAREGVTIVSGLAAGIDTAAHKGAIRAKGRTVAVIGTPVDRVYPASNKALQEEIARKHLLVSQFGKPIGSRAFPMRNRTMALISHVTIVVVAGETSGTRHQAWEALRMNRPLLLSSYVMAAGLSWLDKVLDYGAAPFDSAADVLDALPSVNSLAPNIAL